MVGSALSHELPIVEHLAAHELNVVWHGAEGLAYGLEHGLVSMEHAMSGGDYASLARHESEYVRAAVRAEVLAWSPWARWLTLATLLMMIGFCFLRCCCRRYAQPAEAGSSGDSDAGSDESESPLLVFGEGTSNLLATPSKLGSLPGDEQPLLPGGVVRSDRATPVPTTPASISPPGKRRRQEGDVLALARAVASRPPGAEPPSPAALAPSRPLADGTLWHQPNLMWVGTSVRYVPGRVHPSEVGGSPDAPTARLPSMYEVPGSIMAARTRAGSTILQSPPYTVMTPPDSPIKDLDFRQFL